MEHAIDKKPAHARDHEDVLDHHGAREQPAEFVAGDGDHGEQRILQRVSQNHHPFREALAACRAGIVFPVHLQHGRAGDPRHERHLIEAERERRKEELLQIGERIVPQSGVAQRRHPREKQYKEIYDQDAHPEVWQSHPGNRDDPGDIVGGGILLDRGDQAQWHSDDGGDHHRQNGQFERDRKLLGEVIGNRLLEEHGLAEVQVDHVPYPLAVLNVQRLVGSQLDLQIVQLCLREVGIAGLPCQLHLRRIAGDDAQQQETRQGSPSAGSV